MSRRRNAALGWKASMIAKEVVDGCRGDEVEQGECGAVRGGVRLLDSGGVDRGCCGG